MPKLFVQTYRIHRKTDWLISEIFTTISGKMDPLDNRLILIKYNIDIKLLVIIKLLFKKNWK